MVIVTEFRNNLSKYIQMAFHEKVALRSKSGILELNPSKDIVVNPSPSGDKYFDDPRNVEQINQRIAEVENGTAELIPWNVAKKELGL